MKFFSFSMLTIIIAGTVAISGCAATKPTYRANGAPKIVINEKGVPSHYRVRNGDTISNIAEQYGLNYRNLARLNRLDSKYTIYVGQWLKLWENTQRNTTQPKRNRPVTVPSYPSVSKPVRPQPTGSVNVSNQFQYPTKNSIFRNFGEGNSEGIWFSGGVGDPVYASQAGTVIYVGNDLPEFGNLVMIRHTDKIITAYAHNSQAMVREGTYVNKGQQIAAMGQSGDINRVGLQFQIRNNGTPINPAPFLGR